MDDAEEDLRQMAENGDIQGIRNILYPGWIYPRLVLLRIYKEQQLCSAKK